jgi:hypothetical protein
MDRIGGGRRKLSIGNSRRDFDLNFGCSRDLPVVVRHLQLFNGQWHSEGKTFCYLQSLLACLTETIAVVQDGR